MGGVEAGVVPGVRGGLDGEGVAPNGVVQPPAGAVQILDLPQLRSGDREG